MKKLIFTLILSIILCIAWMLYVNYSHKRFVDDLRIISPSSTQSTNTSDTSVVSDDGETNHVDGTSSEIVDENVFTTDKQMKVGLKEKHPQKATVEDVIKSFEKRLSESDGPEATKTKNAFEDFLESQGVTKEEYEKQAIAREVMQRIINNPMRWLDGNPNLILVTDDEIDALFDAKDILPYDSDQIKSADSILPKGAVGIKQNDDGTWSFVYETNQDATQ